MVNWEYWCWCCWTRGAGIGKASVGEGGLGCRAEGLRCLGRLAVGTGGTGVRLETMMLEGVRIGRRMLETADAGVRVAGAGGVEAGRMGGAGTGEAGVEGNGGRGSHRMVGVLRLGCL